MRMLARLGLGLCLAAPSLAAAQQPYPQQQPYPYYPQQQQQPPPQQQQPYPYYPPQQQPPQQYPYGYPPPQQQPYGYPQQPYPYGPPPQQLPPPRPPRLNLPSASAEAEAATWACADAIDNRHLELARAKCGEALGRDESLAFAHLLLAQAEPPELARGELGRAADLARRSAPGERLFVDAYRAAHEGRVADARRLYDQLIATLPGEPRAFVARGRFRLTAAALDADGALADFRQAAALDPKLAQARGYEAQALAARGQLDEALAAARKYAELAPSEPNAGVTVARLSLAKSDAAAALAAAKPAVATDDKFAPAHVALGDALLFSGKGNDARKEYGALIANEDPEVHHDGAMREARSWLFDGRPFEAEKALAVEGDLAAKTRRPGDQVDALIELARLQLDRGAVSDSGQTLRQAGETLAAPTTLLDDEERRRLQAESLALRAMVLAAVGERALAEARADEMGTALKAVDPRAQDRVGALKGWIAARNRDDQSALGLLQTASRPTLRMALALAAARSGDAARARTIMEELSRRMENDLEGALTRPRAAAWLKAQK